MDRLFYPKSIAVVGVSRNPKKIGHIIAKNIIDTGYQGEFSLVNPFEESVLGYDTMAGVDEIDSHLDVVVIAVPGKLVEEVLYTIIEQKKKVGDVEESYAVIISAGFRETGQEGAELEQKIVQIANENNVRILGPNCLGLMNLDPSGVRFNATFDYTPGIEGGVSLISQSGALISAFLERGEQIGLGFNKVVSIGNKGDLNENEFVEYLDQDLNTSVIALYLESFSEGNKLYEIAKNSSKPIVILKSGRSDIAKEAAQSHTGAIAGNDKVAKAFLESAGVIVTEGLSDFFSSLKLLSKYNKLMNNQVSVITNAGGVGVISLDDLSKTELQLTSLHKITKEKLAKALPSASSVNNPVDILGDAEDDRYGIVLHELLTDPAADSIIVILTPQVNTPIDRIAQIIAEKMNEFESVPVLPVFIGGDRMAGADEIFFTYNVPYFTSPESAISALNNLWKYASKKVKFYYDNSEFSLQNKTNYKLEVNEDINKEFVRNKELNNQILDNEAILKIADSYDIQIPKSDKLSNYANNYNEVFRSISKSVVLKNVDPNLLHRTEKQGVMTDVVNTSQIEFFIQENDPDSVVVQEFVKNGFEVFIGFQNDAEFGMTLILGSGGIYSELMNDFAVGPLPESIFEVETLFSSTKAYQVLSGYRKKIFDLTGFYDQVLKITKFVRDNSQMIQSVDINPIIVTESKSVVVDFKVLI